MHGIKSNFDISVPHCNNINAISNVEKAELLASTFVKIHSSENVSLKAKQSRDNTLAQNPGVTERRVILGDDLDLPFYVFELRRASLSAWQTSPGKDNVCYSVLAHMKDSTLKVV